MYVMGSRAVVGDNLFQDNTGERGGGIYLSNADATIAGNVIRENQGSFGGANWDQYRIRRRHFGQPDPE